MTLIVGMKAIDAIILGADSRGTIGDPRGLTAINDTYQKLFPLGCCGIGVAGASEMGSVLLDELQKRGVGDNSNNIDDAMAQVRQHSAECFTEWFGSIQPSQRPGVLLTLAGYRFPSGQEPVPMIYLLNSQANFAPQLFGHIPCLSGIPQYAVYLVHRYYEPSISTDQAKSLTEYLIAETASQDPKVGGTIHIAEITPVDGYRELTTEEITAIHQSNEDLNQRLRRFFLEGGR
ncbi:MAG TPA: hypothetical protein VMV84_02105 [Dehalococcoidales bacterium]|nr:hypothetical protein [Dehalococcoidales bacterium]